LPPHRPGIPAIHASTARIHGRLQKDIAMLFSLRLACIARSFSLVGASGGRLFRVVAAALACAAGGISATDATAQAIVYQSFSPVVTYATPMAAGYPGGYMANYSPAGNYAAVTAFSPPMATGYVASYPVTQVANYAVESSVAVTSYYAPAPVMAAPTYVAPVTTFYAPSAVAVPLYRRGLFGGLRPVRSATYIPY
jgi:hypothetical protein